MINREQLSGVGSLGAVSYPEHGHTLDELLRYADAARYREKARRRPAEEKHVNVQDETRLSL